MMNHTQIMDEKSPEYLMIKSMLLPRIALAFLFRIGSILIQVGSIPVNNVNMILIQNIIELSVATLTFFLFGNTIVFGDLTEPKWRIGSIFTTNNLAEIEYAIYAWTAITMTTTIFTTMTAGRMHVVAYVAVTMIISGFLQPSAMRLSWTQDSFVRNNTFLDTQVTYIDFGGIGHVHLLAGTAAFLATIFIGRRLIRLKDVDEESLPPGSDTSLAIGYVLVIVGIIGLMLPHPAVNGTFDNPFGIRCGLAINGGILAALLSEMIFVKRRLNSWAIVRCLQGGVAGLVIVSNGTLAYSSLMCLVMGAVGGLLFYFVQHLMFKSALEDNCNVISMHFYCGFFSILLTLRMSDPWNLALAQLAWELIVNTGLVAAYIVCLVPIFLLLAGYDLLRNHQCAIEHRRAMKVQRNQESGGFFKRLFPPGTHPEPLVPGSKMRQKEYQDQRLIEEVEVKLETVENPTSRKRRVEDTEAVTNKKRTSRRDDDDVNKELEDFQFASGKKRFIAKRNIEVRYAAIRNIHPLKFKKSYKYPVNGRKWANMAGGDAGFRLADGKRNWKKRYQFYEDLPDERRVELHEEIKKRRKGIREIIEGSNTLQDVKNWDLHAAKVDNSFEFLYYDHLTENQKIDEIQGDAESAACKDEGDELGSQEDETHD